MGSKCSRNSDCGQTGKCVDGKCVDARGSDDSHKKRKLSMSQMLLGLVLAIALIILLAWVGAWAWNGSMHKMFKGTKKIGWGAMLCFLILLLIVGAFLNSSRASCIIIDKGKK